METIFPTTEDLRRDINKMISELSKLRGVKFDLQQISFNTYCSNLRFEKQELLQEKIRESAKIVDMNKEFEQYNSKAEEEKEFARLKRIELERVISSLHGKIDLLTLEKQQQANKLNRTIRRSNSFNSINTHLYQQPLTTYQQQPVVKSRFLTNSGANFQSDSSRFQFADMSSNIKENSLNKRFDLPSDMTFIRDTLTDRGKEYLFNDGIKELSVVVLYRCDHPLSSRCLLYEYRDSRYFRWKSTLTSTIDSNINNHRIEISFLEDKFFQIITNDGTVIKFTFLGRLEILWQFGDKTIVEQDGERQEFIGKNNKEIYYPDGKAVRKCAATQWKMKEFFPSSTRICCQNGTYSTNFYEKVSESQRQVSLEKTRHSETSVLQITATDFELRRFISTKAVKIVMPADSSSGASIEVLLCSDGSILVNHVRTEKENSLG
uniref:Uncharacterized protein n=1 Tax=Meloidogyne javanica TaxID=6303 RepID=A0A915MM95_MELJA